MTRKPRISVEVPINLLCEIKVMAARRNVTMRRYVMGAVLERIKKDMDMQKKEA